MSASLLRWSVHAMALAAVTAQWRALELYDVLPADCRALDDHSFAHKDYGSAAGDAYYALRTLIHPLLCPACASGGTGDAALCVRYNGIAVGTCFSESATPGPQVARRIIVEVPEPLAFGEYGACNPREGTNSSAEMCEYDCVAASAGAGVSPGIGAQRLTEARICNDAIGRNISSEPQPHRDAIRALQYDYHTCRRLDGWWYSVGSADGAGTLWRSPRLVKAIDSACQMEVMHRQIQNARGTSCFDACSATPANATASTTGAYDTTTPCYTRCFYQTLLGDHGDTNGFVASAGGMSSEEISAAWLQGFDECPDYADPPSGRGSVKRSSHAAHALLP